MLLHFAVHVSTGASDHLWILILFKLTTVIKIHNLKTQNVALKLTRHYKNYWEQTSITQRRHVVKDSAVFSTAAVTCPRQTRAVWSDQTSQREREQVLSGPQFRAL